MEPPETTLARTALAVLCWAHPEPLMRALFTLLLLALAGVAHGAADLIRSEPLTGEDDLSAQMVEGIGRWLERRTATVAQERNQRWNEAARGPQWDKFAEDRRGELRRELGIIDESVPGEFEELRDVVEKAPVGDATSNVGWRRVRWPVLKDVHGEGLLFRPKQKVQAAVIAIPDADQLPEQLAWAQKLAEAGCVVLIPTLISREDRWSGSETLGRLTNQPHREWIHRQAFEMGRTLIGYEVQKLLAAVETLSRQGGELGIPGNAIGVAGYGEGGLLALHCTALELRVRAAMVSGYFHGRDRLFEQPIYRNVFGFLRKFGDAQIAALVPPRKLIIEPSVPPPVPGPPAPREGRQGAAPGSIPQMSLQAIQAEVAAARELVESGGEKAVTLVTSADSLLEQAGSNEAINDLLSALGVRRDEQGLLPAPKLPAISQLAADARQHRAVRELEDFTQRLVPQLERERAMAFWSRVKPGAEWERVQREQRDRLWSDVIGRIPREELLPPSPRSRIVLERPQWVAHEVKLDVLPDVFAWGWLLVPRDLQPGERRPVIVCQHGLEGVPEDVVKDDPKSQAFGYYKAFAARLAERGFIVYAPHNPYRGRDKFRLLQRRANPLGLSLFSFIIAQHDATTRWLGGLPFVDPDRIGFYGLSYGGKTAMRVPAVLDRYCLSICSGDFNEWVRKNVSTDAPYSYMFTGEWEMPEWNLAAVANYAEMAMLIAPRPFMVERGHDDNVGVDEWVAYEFAKVRRGYVKLGISDRAQIEWFDGPHTIHGVGTFEFLHKQLRWPKRD